ncbi:hypothetical protein MKW94_024778 [Papaver nudicaule]|uniref:BHLH domain-containing protein n=1 Tax=Papaver nudicaule TaxID=74823 RepID=A0AA42AX91_PAPNU|nr:hypothetical protein [Papaver nudicaule]
MEQYSGNLHHHHHHQLQEQLNIVGSSSSSSSASSLSTPPPSFYQVLGINNNSSSTWNQNLILNNGGNYFNQNSNVNGVITANSPRDEVISRQNKNNNDDIHHFVPPSLNTSTVHHQNQDLSNFHGRSFIDVNDQSLHELHLAKIKKELLLSSSLDSHSSKLFSNEAIMNNTFSKNYFKNENQLQDFYDEDLSSTNTHLGDLYNNSPETFTGFGNYLSNPLSRGHSNNFSQMMILPSTTISSANSDPQSFASTTTNTSPLGLSSFQALDLLSSSSTKSMGGNFEHGQANSLFKERSLSLNLYNNDMNPGVMNNNWPSTNNPSKVSSLMAGVTDVAKRPRPPGSIGNPKKTPQTAPVKKPRTESRSSIPPLKVRKEKLGDRIANLQQLVAPFGKTDTASVLMEAIGYIKFLQEQVETLSVPYMKSGRNNNNMRPKFQQGMNNARAGEGDTNEPKRDLRSRGLCLVPLSCTQLVITEDNSLSHVNWSTSAPHFGGGSI